MSDPDEEPSHIADSVLEGENLGVVPSLTPVSGNSLMTRSDKVIDDPRQVAFFTNFQMMLDDHEHIWARNIVKPSVKSAIATYSRSIAYQWDGVHRPCLPVLLTVSVLYSDTASSDALSGDKFNSREEISAPHDLSLSPFSTHGILFSWVM